MIEKGNNSSVQNSLIEWYCVIYIKIIINVDESNYNDESNIDLYVHEDNE